MCSTSRVQRMCTDHRGQWGRRACGLSTVIIIILKQSELFCSSGTDACWAFQAAVRPLRLKTSYLSNSPVTSMPATTAFLNRPVWEEELDPSPVVSGGSQKWRPNIDALGQTSPLSHPEPSTFSGRKKRQFNLHLASISICIWTFGVKRQFLSSILGLTGLEKCMNVFFNDKYNCGNLFL